MPAMPVVAVIPKPNSPVELREVPEAQLEENSALLDVELSEVCGTDVYLQKGLLQGVPYPLVPGHVSVGRLSKIRGVLFDVEGRPFAKANRVTFLDVHRTCNSCWYVWSRKRPRDVRSVRSTANLRVDDGLCGGGLSRFT